MRKAIITLLAALMLISFVSCDDQKVTEEMREQATKDFIETFHDSTEYFLGYEIEVGEYDLSNWDSTDETEKVQINEILRGLVPDSNIAFTSAEGTLEVKDVKLNKSEYSAHVIADGIKISYTENVEEKSLTLDYDMSTAAFYSETEGYSGTVVVEKFVLNGKTYMPIECTMTADKTTEKSKFTSAKCDGIDLDCDKLTELVYSQEQ